MAAHYIKRKNMGQYKTCIYRLCIYAVLKLLHIVVVQKSIGCSVKSVVNTFLDNPDWKVPCKY